ncbi:MAG: hypothetical protein ACON38_19925 [Akkermansiaceae bacterium]
MKLLKTIFRRIHHNHELSIRRSRIYYRNRDKAPIHTQLHFESILK